MPEPKNLDKDLAAIRALAEVLEETGLTEIEVERGTVRLRVARGGTIAAAVTPTAAPATAPPAAPAAEAPAASPADDAANHPGAVTAPMVGTAYMSPSPGSDPFISEGATVNAGQTILIIEAMKTMNEIKAPKAGKVTKILARDAEPVEFGEPLVVIE
ncbi:MAG: acetyl-CoA carboxylase biotin carboxyl carrier protein [Pseudomonadota bacterium]